MLVVGPVDKISGYAIGDRHPIADNELAPFHVSIEDRRHGNEFLACENNVLRQTLGFGVQKGVPGYSPQRLLEFSHGEHDRAECLGPLLEIGRQQPLVAILSARYMTIAADSVSTRSPSTSTGTLPAGLRRRKTGRRCSPAAR